jgi:hypothetical protein
MSLSFSISMISFHKKAEQNLDIFPSSKLIPLAKSFFKNAIVATFFFSRLLPQKENKIKEIAIK